MPLVARWWLALGPVEQLVPGLHRSGSLVVPGCAGDLVCGGQHGDNPVRIFAARDEIVGRHAAMVEVGLSETGGGITGALGKAASRVVPDPMSRLHHVSAMHRLAARRCSGIFPQLFRTQDGEPRH